MSGAKQALELQTETGSDSAHDPTRDPARDPANVTIDLSGEFDAAVILLELRNAFVSFREEMRRDLRSIRADTDFTRKHLKHLGLRLTAIEADKEQIEEEVRVLASGTPPPAPYPPGEVLP